MQVKLTSGMILIAIAVIKKMRDEFSFLVNRLSETSKFLISKSYKGGDKDFEKQVYCEYRSL